MKRGVPDKIVVCVAVIVSICEATGNEKQPVSTWMNRDLTEVD